MGRGGRKRLAGPRRGGAGTRGGSPLVYQRGAHNGRDRFDKELKRGVSSFVEANGSDAVVVAGWGGGGLGGKEGLCRGWVQRRERRRKKRVCAAIRRCQAQTSLEPAQAALGARNCQREEWGEGTATPGVRLTVHLIQPDGIASFAACPPSPFSARAPRLFPHHLNVVDLGLCPRPHPHRSHLYLCRDGEVVAGAQRLVRCADFVG